MNAWLSVSTLVAQLSMQFPQHRIDIDTARKLAHAFAMQDIDTLFAMEASYNPLQRETALALRLEIDRFQRAAAKQHQAVKEDDLKPPSWVQG